TLQLQRCAVVQIEADVDGLDQLQFQQLRQPLPGIVQTCCQPPQHLLDTSQASGGLATAIEQRFAAIQAEARAGTVDDDALPVEKEAFALQMQRQESTTRGQALQCAALRRQPQQGAGIERPVAGILGQHDGAGGSGG